MCEISSSIGAHEMGISADGLHNRLAVTCNLASSPGRQLKFGKKDGLVSIATPLVRMRWPLPEKVVIVYFACNRPDCQTARVIQCMELAILNSL